ncbi:MAG TPA: YeeE/YedE family protein [Burkholderiaceae bacterium]|nr:YeeE/YedE family protein [Burkholderiaceae bacterium]
MHLFSAFAVGLIFGVGLLVSGLANPAAVLGFLDLAGLWNPTLAFVMAGAIGVGTVAFAFARRRAVTLFGGAMHLPSARDIDRRLVLGSAVFGIGWGLAGICPGPSLVLLGAGAPQAVVFVAAMLAGMALFELHERARRAQPDAAPSSGAGPVRSTPGGRRAL